MDPDATLTMIGGLLEQQDKLVNRDDDIQTGLQEACEHLQEWLRAGGFAPRWSSDIHATEYFLAWCEGKVPHD